MPTANSPFPPPPPLRYAFGFVHYLLNRGKLTGDLGREGLDVRRTWHTDVDTDGDGALSENELLTLAALVAGDAPSEKDIDALRACLSPDLGGGPVTVDHLFSCELALDGLARNARAPRDAVAEPNGGKSEVAFEMVGDDVNATLKQLDSIRARRSKFVCVNDNMKDPSAQVLAVLADFYDSFFPLPCQFELPPGRRNRFLRLDEHDRWRRGTQAIGAASLAAAVVFVAVWARAGA